MKFLCGSCRTKYQISDDKVRGKILTIRCKKCGAKILVRESLATSGGTAVAPVAEDDTGVTARRSVTVQPPSPRHEASGAQSSSPPVGSARTGGSAALASAYELAMGQGASDSDDMPTSIAPVPANLDMAGVEWYTAVDGAQQGPFAFAEVVKKVEGGSLVGRHYVWHDGMANWTRLRDVADLAKYLPAPRRVPPPPPLPAEEPQRPDAQVVELAARRAQLGQDLLDRDATPVEPTKAAPAPASASTKATVRTGGAATAERHEPDPRYDDGLSLEAAEAPSRPNERARTQDVDDDMLAGEDLFANIPRASLADDVQRESTRFFVAAAGVNKQRDRRRIGLIAAIATGVVLLGFVGTWAAGLVSVRLPGIGDPFANMRQGRPLTEDEPPREQALSAKERDLLKGKRKAKPRRRRPAGDKPADVRGLAALGGDYIDDDSGARRTGPRGGSRESIDIGALESDGVGRDGKLPEAKLPTTSPDLPVPDGASLTQDAVSRVVKQNSMSVRFCYQQSLKGSKNLRGKLQIKLRVEPSGKVSRTEVQTSQFKGTKLASCISDKIKKWVFPRFDGEAREFLVPFVLEKSF